MTDAIYAWRLVCWTQRVVIVGLLLVILAGCAIPPTPLNHAAGRIDFIALDQCTADYFGVEPLGEYPRLVTASRADIAGRYIDATGEGSLTTRFAGGPATAILRLASDVSPDRIRLVLFHEYVHLYQHYRLGISQNNYTVAEAHAQKHQNRPRS